MAELNWKGKLKSKIGGAREALRKHTPEEKEFIKEHGGKAREVLANARKVAKKMGDAKGLKWHELKPGHKLPGLHQKWVTVKRVKKYPKRSGVGVEFKEGGYDIRDWDDEV